MLKICLGFLLIFLTVSCAKDSDPSGDLSGTYSGVYLRSGFLPDTGTVRLVFVGSNFSGESEGADRSICNGSYQVFGDSINFTNFCSIPDADLLLVGKYKMTETGDSLFFTRTSDGIVYFEEHFNLRKQ